VDALRRRVQEARRGQGLSRDQLADDPEFGTLIEALVEHGHKSDAETAAAREEERRAALTPEPLSAVDVLPPLPPEAEQECLPTRVPAATRRGVVTWSRWHRGHFSRDYPLEAPERVESSLATLAREGVIDAGACPLQEAWSARAADLETVHDPAYVESIRTSPARGVSRLPGTVYLAPGSWQAVLGAADCALQAGRAVRAGADFAFALTRPPGHHATRNSPAGYCLFNNSAILAKELSHEGRVMVLNWDVHASNGTKRIFYSDGDVLTFSLHRDPTNFFPGEGFVEEIGEGPGEGFSVNVPLPQGSGDEEYILALEELFRPVYTQFRPRHLVVECGFDAHHADPIGGQKLTAGGYYEMAKFLLRLHTSGLALTLEGGYNVATIGLLCGSVISALLDRPNVFLEDTADLPAESDDELSFKLVGWERGRSRKEKRPVLEARAVVDRVKSVLAQRWSFQ